jgi:hypothetical protein
VLFIEPQQPPSDQPVIDDATRKMAGAYRRSQPSRYESCGFHSCSCGAISDHVNHVLPDGTLTNSLCVHYLAYHRHEVSAFELGYARQLSEDGVLPTSDELHGPEPSGRGPRPIDRLRRRYYAAIA